MPPPGFPNLAGWWPGGGTPLRRGSRRHDRGPHSPVDLAAGPVCMALSSWSAGWLDREKIQISATLTEASLMLLQRLSTWPPSEGCCITWGQGTLTKGTMEQGAWQPQHQCTCWTSRAFLPVVGTSAGDHGSRDRATGPEDKDTGAGWVGHTRTWAPGGQAP